MWACTYGIDRWMPAKLVGRSTSKLVNRLTAKLVNRLTAKLMNLLTAQLVDRLTAKLVVVNLVKLHLTKFKRQEVLLPINHNFNKICDIISYFLNQNTRNSKFCFASSEKKAI